MALLKSRKLILTTLISVASTMSMTSAATAINLKITVENISPEQGLFISPVWFGFHDGSFDTFNLNEAASVAIERIAEDGTTQEITDDFAPTGGVQGVIPADGPFPDFIPGDGASTIVSVNPDLPDSRYFSFASMILPSNDGFLGNDDPLAYRIFDDNGNFIPTSIVVLGAEILDAGTEVNDESRENAALVGPTPLDDFMPDTGIDENEVVLLHPGFLNSGDLFPNGNILGDPNFANADFTQPGYQVARITITTVPEPSAVAGLLLLGGLFFLGRPKSNRGGKRQTES